MTPFELALENELNVEWQRFDSEWLFQWYGMTYEGGKTDVPDFKGGRIQYAGIKFGYQQEQIFWHAINRYLNGKVHELFVRWETETKGYPTEARLASIDGVERILGRFWAKITSRGLETAERLRGDGRQTNAKGSISSLGGEIKRLADAHRQMLKALAETEAKPVNSAALAPERFVKRAERFIGEYKGILSVIGLLIAAIGLGAKFLTK